MVNADRIRASADAVRVAYVERGRNSTTDPVAYVLDRCRDVGEWFAICEGLGIPVKLSWCNRILGGQLGGVRCGIGQKMRAMFRRQGIWDPEEQMAELLKARSRDPRYNDANIQLPAATDWKAGAYRSRKPRRQQKYAIGQRVHFVEISAGDVFGVIIAPRGYDVGKGEYAVCDNSGVVWVCEEKELRDINDAAPQIET